MKKLLTTLTILAHLSASAQKLWDYKLVYGDPINQEDIPNYHPKENPTPLYCDSVRTTEQIPFDLKSTFTWWAFSTIRHRGYYWARIQCPDILVKCWNNGEEIPCKCYRLIQKKIENFNPLPAVINPVVKPVYRA